MCHCSQNLAPLPCLLSKAASGSKVLFTGAQSLCYFVNHDPSFSSKQKKLFTLSSPASPQERQNGSEIVGPSECRKDPGTLAFSNIWSKTIRQSCRSCPRRDQNSDIEPLHRCCSTQGGIRYLLLWYITHCFRPFANDGNVRI